MKIKHLSLFLALAKRNVILLRRYPVDLLGLIVSINTIFYLIFKGGQAVAPVALDNSLGAIIVGFFIFSTVQSAFFYLSGMISNEAQYGTLEHLYFSPFRFENVMFMAAVSNIILTLFVSASNGIFMLVVTRASITLDLVSLTPLFIALILQAIGVSFIFAGASLIFKRIRGTFQIVQFAFIILISFSFSDNLWPKMLPVGKPASMMYDVVVDGRHVTNFLLPDYLMLAGTTLLYLFLGMAVFVFAHRTARQRGLLDEY